MATIVQHKIVISNSADAFQLKLNQVAKEFNAFATQTHVTFDTKTNSTQYTAVLFYKQEA